LVAVEIGRPAAFVGAELADARAYADAFAPLNTSHVNAVDLLTAYGSLTRRNVFAGDGTLVVRAGRVTLNRGSRRLVARNSFRNTINAFTGVDLEWTSGRETIRTFAVVPVVRRPADAARLARNAAQLDRENGDALLWGVEYQRGLPDGLRVEAYVIGLQEGDAVFASSDRRLFTPGARLIRTPAPGRLDFDLEGMAQLGRSRASTAASDRTDLTHRAVSVHASAGYWFETPWTPRLLAQYDFASGDADPQDDRNGRFDPLFGARAFELNATGFYGAFARSNISSPGLRVEAAPTGRVDLMGAWRRYWLASARDGWTTAGHRDETGSSGRFVGSQIELRLRAHVVPDVATLEVGGAVLARGSFARRAPGGRGEPALYLYTQLTISGRWP
jgi:hypothetical protein